LPLRRRRAEVGPHLRVNHLRRHQVDPIDDPQIHSHQPPAAATCARGGRLSPDAASEKDMPGIKDVADQIKTRLSRSNDVEFLAQLFEDKTIADTGSGNNEVKTRLETILSASASPLDLGMTHFSGIFEGCRDRGFRKAFEDPWESSGNQVGHFSTAVDMAYRPSRVTVLGAALPRPRPWSTVLPTVWLSNVPAGEWNAVALIIGHEKLSDKGGLLSKVGAVGLAKPEEIVTFYAALGTISKAPGCDTGRSLLALRGIEIGNGEGNSIEDLHLSLYGYKFGTLIRMGEINTLTEAARWIRADLGAGKTPA
jgi:hypothetical protein